MIGKAIIGNSFYACLNYCLNPEKSPIIMRKSGVIGDKPLSLANEFDVVAQLRKGISKPVWHSTISFAHDDKVNDQLIYDVVNDYLDEIGLKEHQFVLIKHQDTKHEHVHLVINKIGFDGIVIRDYRSGYKTMKIMQTLEKKYDLIQAQKQVNQRKEKIRLLIETGLKERYPLPKIFDSIRQEGYEVTYNKTTSGNIRGVSFRNKEKGINYKSSAIDRKYSYAKLKKVTSKNIHTYSKNEKGIN